MNHYDSNYAANLDRDDDEEDFPCDRCGDEFGDGNNPLHDGRWVCDTCLFEICDELLREQAKAKPTVGPATQRVIDSVRTKITQEAMYPGVGYVFNFSIKVDDAKAFLAEQEAKP